MFKIGSMEAFLLTINILSKNEKKGMLCVKQVASEQKVTIS